MCLISKSKWTIAKGDIICYKHLYAIKKKPFWKRLFSFFKYYYRTPYMRFKVNDIHLRAKGSEEVIFSNGEFIIKGGFIHTYKYLLYSYTQDQANHMFKCIIPDGTKYYIGDGEYASKEIIILERL